MAIKVSTRGKNACGNAQHGLSAIAAMSMGGAILIPPIATALGLTSATVWFVSAILGKLHQDPPRDTVSLEVYAPPRWPRMPELPATLDLDFLRNHVYPRNVRTPINVRKYARELLSVGIATTFVLRNIEELAAVSAANARTTTLKQVEVLGLNEYVLSTQTLSLANSLRHLADVSLSVRLDEYTPRAPLDTQIDRSSTLRWLDDQLEAVGYRWVLDEIDPPQELREAATNEPAFRDPVEAFWVAAEGIEEITSLLRDGEFVVSD